MRGYFQCWKFTDSISRWPRTRSLFTLSALQLFFIEFQAAQGDVGVFSSGAYTYSRYTHTHAQSIINNEMCLEEYQQIAIVSDKRHNVQVKSMSVRGSCSTDCQHFHILKACHWEASVSPGAAPNSDLIPSVVTDDGSEILSHLQDGSAITALSGLKQKYDS